MVILRFRPKVIQFFDLMKKGWLLTKIWNNYGNLCQNSFFGNSETERILFENGYFRIPKFGTQINYFKKIKLLFPWKSLKYANMLILAYRVEQSCQYKRQEAKETLHCFYTFHAFLQRWHIQVFWHVCPFSEDFLKKTLWSVIFLIPSVFVICINLWNIIYSAGILTAVYPIGHFWQLLNLPFVASYLQLLCL